MNYDHSDNTPLSGRYLSINSNRNALNLSRQRVHIIQFKVKNSLTVAIKFHDRNYDYAKMLFQFYLIFPFRYVHILNMSMEHHLYFCSIISLHSLFRRNMKLSLPL